MVQKLPTISEEYVVQQKCCHHWIIESAAGPTSQGVCKFCGAQKEFENYLSDCLGKDDEGYQKWLGRQRHDKEEGELDEDRLLRLVGTGKRE